ncbi:MAG: hypothetical protein GY797_33475 [Deltaproteobacteria bacterium]|nr:hypothetical protein [Deltaproteobacteria bacterium]
MDKNVMDEIEENINTIIPNIRICMYCDHYDQACRRHSPSHDEEKQRHYGWKDGAKWPNVSLEDSCGDWKFGKYALYEIVREIRKVCQMSTW